MPLWQADVVPRARAIRLFVLVVASGCGEPGAPPGWSDVLADGGVPDIDVPSVAAAEHRPAVTGGSLLVTANHIVYGDPDRAAIYVLGEEARAVELEPEAGPGRMVEDAGGHVHVVLRGAGAILTIDPSDARVLDRRAICPAPRGIDHDPETDLLHVACAGGELISLPPGDGPRTIRRLPPDLRDVVVADGVLYVSRFRSAELLVLDRESGAIRLRREPNARVVSSAGAAVRTSPNTAWRIRAVPGGGIAMLHQSSVSSPIDVARSGYHSGVPRCDHGVTAPAITYFPPGTTPGVGGGRLVRTPLAVDLAVHPEGLHFAVARASAEGAFQAAPVQRIDFERIEDACVFGQSGSGTPAVGVEFRADGTLVTAHPDPLRIAAGNDHVYLGDALPAARGHHLFHAATPSFVACASCHPEGGEDGHTWTFMDSGPRRTQSLTGGLLATAPFHWNGDQADMGAIMVGSFVSRMGADPVSAGDITEIGAWLDGLAPPDGSPRDADAVERGRALFASAGCAGCHAGAALTNDATMEVGTGGAFQVPSLRGVMHRAPYFHDGCAETLDDVLTDACAPSGSHGDVAALDVAARSDLVDYLRSL